ncbi:hypothetical protein [Streptomyces californicus]|uniref:hypothetical protein n=1 Tax=Streptomyces californicus TaxID=67351 RepID=UPI0033D3B349
MSALQQHLLDIHRAARLSRPAPPPLPGRHDGAVLRALYRCVARRSGRGGVPSGGPHTTGRPTPPGPSGA